MTEQWLGLALDTADPDADGLSNLAEDPLGENSRQSTPPMPGVQDGIGFSISFTAPPAYPASIISPK